VGKEVKMDIDQYFCSDCGYVEEAAVEDQEDQSVISDKTCPSCGGPMHVKPEYADLL
jgi:hypothetical protein